jgi:hypothetical protein
MRGKLTARGSRRGSRWIESNAIRSFTAVETRHVPRLRALAALAIFGINSRE